MLPFHKVKLWRSLFVAVALNLLLSLSFAQTTPAKTEADAPDKTAISQQQKEEVLAKINDIIEKSAFVPGVDFTKWPSFLSAERADIDKAANQKEFSASVNKALRKFGFSHIVLITPEAAQARISEKSVGIGIMIQLDTDGLRVMNVFPDSPASEVGLQVGDLIIEGNGKKPQTAFDLQGEENTALTIKVRHTNGKEQEYSLTRRKYSNVRPETLTWASKDTAVLKVNTFDVSYNRENVEALMKQAEDANAKNLILDLRSNPGGSILNLMHLMSMLLPPNTPMGTFITRTTVDRYMKEQKGKPTDLAAIARWSKGGKLLAMKNDIPYFKGHIAVIVNGGSGSASEIAAAALRDDVDAPIVGTKSAGAVLVSIMNQIPDGFLLQFPITDFVTVTGVRLEGTGVVPIVETPGLVKYNEKDLAIEKAALLLERADLRDLRGASASIHQ